MIKSDDPWSIYEEKLNTRKFSLLYRFKLFFVCICIGFIALVYPSGVNEMFAHSQYMDYLIKQRRAVRRMER